MRTRVAIDSLAGKAMRLNVRKRPGFEDEDVLGDAEGGAAGGDGGDYPLHSPISCEATYRPQLSWAVPCPLRWASQSTSALVRVAGAHTVPPVKCASSCGVCCRWWCLLAVCQAPFLTSAGRGALPQHAISQPFVLHHHAGASLLGKVSSWLVPSSSSSSSAARTGGGGWAAGSNLSAEDDPEAIHIFTVASGHMYERLQKIMVLSVLRTTKCAPSAPLHGLLANPDPCPCPVVDTALLDTKQEAW